MVYCLVLKSGKQTHPNYLLIIDVTHLTDVYRNASIHYSLCGFIHTCI